MASAVPPRYRADGVDTQAKSLPAKVTHSSGSDEPIVMSTAPHTSMRTSRLTVGRCSCACSTKSAMTASGTQT